MDKICTEVKLSQNIKKLYCKKERLHWRLNDIKPLTVQALYRPDSISVEMDSIQVHHHIDSHDMEHQTNIWPQEVKKQYFNKRQKENLEEIVYKC